MGPQAPERELEPISSWSNAARTAIGPGPSDPEPESGPAPGPPDPDLAEEPCAISAASPACVAERLSRRPDAKNSLLAPKTAGACVSAITTSYPPIRAGSTETPPG